MSFKSIEDVINFAIAREKEAVAFYEDAIKQESYVGARKTFEAFATEERKHVALLEGFLRGETKLTDYTFEWIPDMKRSNYMVDLTYEKGMSYPDALRLAMKREEKALALYNELKEKVDEKELVRVFKMLAQEEAKHKLALETLYDDYMAKQGD